MLLSCKYVEEKLLVTRMKNYDFRNGNSFWEADFYQEKKNQGTNENHLGAILWTKDIMGKQSWRTKTI